MFKGSINYLVVRMRAPDAFTAAPTKAVEAHLLIGIVPDKTILKEA
jgi:hypothetical protein